MSITIRNLSLVITMSKANLKYLNLEQLQDCLQICNKDLRMATICNKDKKRAKLEKEREALQKAISS